MMEVEDLAEYRSLLGERNNAPFYTRIKYACIRQPAERKIIAAIAVCFTIGVVFIGLKQSLIDSNSKEPFLNTYEEILWQYTTTEERETFLRLWNNANETLSSIIGSYAEKKNGKNDQRSQLFAECELILETVKRTLKKCVSLQVLPTKCKKLLLKKMRCKKGVDKYRAWDGSCNNLEHTDWGMSGNNFNRWLRATYMDDVSVPRQSVSGGELPPVRYLSNLLFSHKTMPDSNISTFFTLFGLFLDHDIIQVGQTQGNYSSCCETAASQRHPACMKIEIAEDDPLYGPLNLTCKGFLRSPPFTGSCPGLREQQNRMTSYIDESNLYGPSHEAGRLLRTGKKGLMLQSIVNGATLLPVAEDSGSNCFSKYSNNSCFLSGDIRVNLLMPLMTVHTIWLREHNRIATELSQINPKWDDETLYQESRKIVIAEYQNIIYKRFLPIIFGSQRMEEHGLLIETDKAYNGYNPNTNAGINTAFATAAFRFGHTLVQSKVQLRDENYNLKSDMPLHMTYMNPSVLYHRGFDEVVRGMINQKAQDADHFTSVEIRGRLFQKYDMTNGYDLTALSILRGRDHGIPPYLRWREFCKLQVPRSWEEMENFMKEGYVETLQKGYRSIEDIDLLAGAIGENHLEGALLGPTHICLLGKQFSALRKGDRFWFENFNHPGAFTKDQLNEIYKSSLPRVLCDTSDDIKKIPINPFYVASDENPIIDCAEIRSVDLNKWKEP